MKFFDIIRVTTFVVFLIATIVEAQQFICPASDWCQNDKKKRSVCKYEFIEGQDSYCTLCVATRSIKAHINAIMTKNTCGVCDNTKVCRTPTPTRRLGKSID